MTQKVCFLLHASQFKGAFVHGDNPEARQRIYNYKIYYAGQKRRVSANKSLKFITLAKQARQRKS